MRLDQRVPEHSLPNDSLELLELHADVLEVSDRDRAGELAVRPRPHERPAARLAVPLVQPLLSVDRALAFPAQSLIGGL